MRVSNVQNVAPTFRPDSGVRASISQNVVSFLFQAGFWKFIFRLNSGTQALHLQNAIPAFLSESKKQVSNVQNVVPDLWQDSGMNFQA